MLAHGKSSVYLMARSSRYVRLYSLRRSSAYHQLGTERFLAPEILFNPELVGHEYPGVHQVSL
jgi:hypothetical protein